MNEDEHFTNNQELEYPSEDDYINIKVLNNNTKLLDEKKANITDLTDVARESSPKAIENAIKNINSVVSGNLQGVARERSTYSIEDKIRALQSTTSSLQSELYNFKNRGMIKRIQVLKGTKSSNGSTFTPFTLNISPVNPQKTILIVQSFGSYHIYDVTRLLIISQLFAELINNNTIRVYSDSMHVDYAKFAPMKAHYNIQIVEFY